MVVTEQEARGMWCPMARVDVGGEGVASVNRRERRRQKPEQTWERSNAACWGAHCMAWRETTPGSGKGFCGLAGEVAR